MKYGVTWEITPATDLNAFGQVPVLCKKLQRSKHV